ncbi:MAG: DUF2092 domain-containing protein [Candidatus Entotheonellia bacterium]
MMVRYKSFGWALLLALGLLLAASGAGVADTQRAPQAAKKKAASRGSPVAPAAEPVLEPQAIEILKAASDRLAAARSMSFAAMISYESPSRLGPPLVYTTRAEVTLQRPDKLRVITPGDGPASEFYYDGKTMMAFEPAANLVAVAEAPPTIDAALQAAYDAAAIYFPFTDVIVTDPYQGLADELQHAFYIGQSRVVGGTTTDMVAIVNKWVFEQIWIGADDKLPRKARAVFLADPSRLRHEIEFSNWQLDPAVPAEAFASSSAGAATRIAFSRPDLKLPPGLKPPARGKSSTTQSKPSKRQ